MSEDKDADLSAAVAKLGVGYKGRSDRARRPIPESGNAPAAAAAGANVEKDDSVAASALRARYRYRRPVPPPDDCEDGMVPGKQDNKKESELHELENNLEKAATGPPHAAGNDAADDGDGGDGDGDGAAHGKDGDAADNDGLCSSHSTSMDPEEVAAFAKEWDDEDGAGGQKTSAEKRASSLDPASFQDAREASRSVLTMGAFFASMGKEMLSEHKKTCQEADFYMSEVTLANSKLPITANGVFSYKSSISGGRVARPGGTRPPQGQGLRVEALAALQGTLCRSPRYEEACEGAGY